MTHQTFPKNVTKSDNNHGNALVLILVLIALIAALTAVAMRSTNRSTTNMDTETARIQAEKLIRQAIGFETATNHLMTVNQCSENDINFDNTITTRDYTNSHSPVNKNCHLFDMAGAGLTYSNPNSVIFDPIYSGDSDYQQWVFTSGFCVLGIGSDDDDTCDDKEVALMVVVPHINTSVCMQVNALNSIENPSGAPPSESMDGTLPTFDGEFDAVSDSEIGEGVTGVNLKKHATGCFKSDSGSWANSNVFYHILLAR